MRHLITALLALGFVATAGAAELRIGVLDPMAAMAGTEQYKKSMAVLKNDVAKDETQLNRLQTELMGCDQKMKKDAPMMSATDQARLKTDCENKAREFQALGQAYQSTVQERQKAALKEIAPKLEQAVEAVNREMGFDMIIQREAAVWAKPEFDMTAKVTERLNAMAGTPAPAAPAKPGAAKPAATKPAK